MAEVLVKFSVPVRGGDRRLYWSQVCGRVAPDGLWEGWIEFESERTFLRTARESEQPNRKDLKYWAQGLTMAYLEGAIERARQFTTATSEHRASTQTFNGKPRFDRPARGETAVRHQAPSVEPGGAADGATRSANSTAAIDRNVRRADSVEERAR